MEQLPDIAKILNIAKEHTPQAQARRAAERLGDFAGLGARLFQKAQIPVEPLLKTITGSSPNFEWNTPAVLGALSGFLGEVARGYIESTLAQSAIPPSPEIQTTTQQASTPATQTADNTQNLGTPTQQGDKGVTTPQKEKETSAQKINKEIRDLYDYSRKTGEAIKQNIGVAYSYYSPSSISIPTEGSADAKLSSMAAQAAQAVEKGKEVYENKTKELREQAQKDDIIKTYHLVAPPVGAIIQRLDELANKKDEITNDEIQELETMISQAQKTIYSAQGSFKASEAAPDINWLALAITLLTNARVNTGGGKEYVPPDKEYLKKVKDQLYDYLYSPGGLAKQYSERLKYYVGTAVRNLIDPVDILPSSIPIIVLGDQTSLVAPDRAAKSDEAAAKTKKESRKKPTAIDTLKVLVGNVQDPALLKNEEVAEKMKPLKNSLAKYQEWISIIEQDAGLLEKLNKAYANEEKEGMEKAFKNLNKDVGKVDKNKQLGDNVINSIVYALWQIKKAQK